MTDTMIFITKHGYERLAERLRYNRKAAERMVAKAYKEGTSTEKTKSIAKKYLKYKAYTHDYRSEYRIYGEYLFIYGKCEGGVVFITVHILPPTIRKNARYSTT